MFFPCSADSALEVGLFRYHLPESWPDPWTHGYRHGHATQYYTRCFQENRIYRDYTDAQTLSDHGCGSFDIHVRPATW